MKERLLKFLNTENLSATKFADEIGVQRSSISHILSGRNKPSYDFIYKTLNKYDYISAEWLISGKGGMYKEGIEKKGDGVTEQELFTNTEKEQNKNKIKGKTEELTDEINITEEVKEKKDNINKSDMKSVERVIIFFSDGKFREYSPE
jgi:transcriptional regulator with XRE-family HTH domain